MIRQTIHSAKTTQILFEGKFESFKDCLEQAIFERTDLTGADLKNRNLTNACLDDAMLSRADFSGSNLTGTNLSEASLHGAIFENCDLYNTCLAYTDLRNCDFQNASFGGTEITGALLSDCRFSTLSCFSLDFASTEKMENCAFVTTPQKTYPFSKPPIVIRGIGYKLLVFSEEFWMNGTTLLPYSEQFHPIVSLRRTIHTSG